ncbi:MAG: peptide MFS transporter [Bacteroidaceae bacterium]|nr:peptide MFS transporter [Bacteroidaceae bacterium]MBP5731228.1 peptide MFS transporter [Bacteroidaceae bacterium]
MFEGQPKGLWALAFANTGERFGYYTMLAVFILFLQANFGWSSGTAGVVYSSFLMLVYFLPLFGGIAADKWGYSKMVTIGIFIMFAGYALLAIPLGASTVAIVAMAAALLLVSFGTGLFKGNLQVMVGDLYNDPKYANKRDSGFSLFYMLINVGALFAPTAAIKIMEWAQTSLGISKEDSYHFAFAVACVSLIVSILIYYGFKSTFKQVLTPNKKDAAAAATVENKADELTPSQTKERIICLCLVFAVVIFFWMAFHQNGATLTYFARDYVATQATGLTAMEFDVVNLLAVIFVVYGLFGVFQSKGNKARAIYGILIVLGAVWLIYKYQQGAQADIAAPIFQQFNPCFVVLLTPVSIGLFGWLAKKGKEPKAPVKIGLGMLVAACAYLLMTMSSLGLPAPNATNPEHLADCSPNILVSTYLILTFAELLLSPIGISFVSKVAPPKYKGMMMGGWFVATAIGNFLVSIPTLIWGKTELYIVWGVLMAICLVAALFIFSIIKKLNKVA